MRFLGDVSEIKRPYGWTRDSESPVKLSGNNLALTLGVTLGLLMVALTRESGDELRNLGSSDQERREPETVTGRLPAVASNRSGESTIENALGTPHGRELQQRSVADPNLNVPSDDRKSTQAAIPPSSYEEAPLYYPDATQFHISASVDERCRTRPAPTPDSCSTMNRILDAVQNEERAESWAAKTEARISAVVAARQDGTRIRMLVCKQSLCAIETESPGAYEHLSILRQSEQDEAGVVDDGNFVLAWENDPYSGPLTITVRAYKRRY